MNAGVRMDFPEMLARLTTEQKILVLCSRLMLSAEKRRLAEHLFNGPVNWAELLRLSQRHLVTALVYRSLESGGLSQKIPAGIREQMRNSSTRNLARNMQKRTVLLAVLDRLESQGIRTVVLKGNALVHTIYRDESLRTFTDIDLLINRSGLDAGKRVMSGLGYRLASGIYPVSDELNEELGCEWTYVNQDGVIIELHWDLLDKQSPFTIDPAQLIERAVPFLLDGRRIYALTVEDELVHLCIHQFKHHWQRLRDLCDINEITVQTEVDWDSVLHRSHESSADKCLLYTLMLARNIMDAHVPGWVVEKLQCRVRPGIVSGSIFELIEKNFLSYGSPHGYWPVILVDSRKEKMKIIRDNTRKQIIGKDSAGERPGPGHKKKGSQEGRLLILRESLVSLLCYRPLLAQLLGSLLKNAAAAVGSWK